MKTINFKLANGQLVQMQVSDEDYKSFKEVQRPYWREEKRKQRRGLSLEQFLEDNDFEIADESQNPETLLLNDYQATERQKAFQLKKLRQGMIKLSEKQSSAIHKYFFLKMNYLEIAREEDVDESTIRERIQSALKKLKKLF